jgi:hypothetical protein
VHADQLTPPGSPVTQLALPGFFVSLLQSEVSSGTHARVINLNEFEEEIKNTERGIMFEFNQ